MQKRDDVLCARCTEHGTVDGVFRCRMLCAMCRRWSAICWWMLDVGSGFYFHATTREKIAQERKKIISLSSCCHFWRGTRGIAVPGERMLFVLNQPKKYSNSMKKIFVQFQTFLDRHAHSTFIVAKLFCILFDVFLAVIELYWFVHNWITSSFRLVGNIPLGSHLIKFIYFSIRLPISRQRSELHSTLENL